jgi:hypothetical protein
LAGKWVVYSLFDCGNAENYGLMMDYEYQGKKEEIHKLKYKALEIYIYYPLDFIKYFLSVNNNSGGCSWVLGQCKYSVHDE